jgi:hypothetical protein
VGEVAAGAVVPGPAGALPAVPGVDVAGERASDESSAPGPVYVPGAIEYPGPYAGVGKSSHSSQWNSDQWANEQPITLGASAAAITMLRSFIIIEILSVPAAASSTIADGRPVALCLP